MSAVVEISKQKQAGKEPIQKIEIKKGSGMGRGPRNGTGPRARMGTCPKVRYGSDLPNVSC